MGAHERGTAACSASMEGVVRVPESWGAALYAPMMMHIPREQRRAPTWLWWRGVTRGDHFIIVSACSKRCDLHVLLSSWLRDRDYIWPGMFSGRAVPSVEGIRTALHGNPRPSHISLVTHILQALTLPAPWDFGAGRCAYDSVCVVRGGGVSALRQATCLRAWPYS